MKTIFLLTIMVLAGCAVDQLDQEQLELREGIAYARGSDEPFSGRAIRMSSDGGIWQEIEYVDGLRHGSWRSYHGAFWGSGRETLHTYEHGVLQGPARRWYEWGGVHFKGSCDKGQPHGTCRRYFGNGKKMGQATFNHGQLEGTLTLWYDNGQKRVEVTIGTDPQTGTYQCWKSDGTLAASGPVVNGILVGSPEEKSLADLDGRAFLFPDD